jgi:hypothetical protein
MPQMPPYEPEDPASVPPEQQQQPMPPPEFVPQSPHEQPQGPYRPPESFPPANPHGRAGAGAGAGYPGSGHPGADPFPGTWAQPCHLPLVAPPSGWRTVRTAVLLQLVAILILVGCVLANIIGLVGALRRSSGGPASIAGTAQILGFLILGGWLLYVASWGMCLAVPVASGLRGKAIAAFVMLLASMVLVVVSIFSVVSQVISAGPLFATNPRLTPQMGVMMLLAGFSGFVAWGLMMSFLHGVGVTLNNPEASNMARATSTTTLMSFVCAFVVPPLAALGMLAALVMYLMTLSRVRTAITKGPQRRFARPV